MVKLPYVRYTELDMDVCGVKLGGVGVLISKESGKVDQPTGLLGCNVISEVRAALEEKHGRNYLKTVKGSVNHCWAEVLLALELGEQQSPKLEFARLKGRKPI